MVVGHRTLTGAALSFWHESIRRCARLLRARGARIYILASLASGLGRSSGSTACYSRGSACRIVAGLWCFRRCELKLLLVERLQTLLEDNVYRDTRRPETIEIGLKLCANNAHLINERCDALVVTVAL